LRRCAARNAAQSRKPAIAAGSSREHALLGLERSLPRGELEPTVPVDNVARFRTSRAKTRRLGETIPIKRANIRAASASVPFRA
jgi:hypothetical protein